MRTTYLLGALVAACLALELSSAQNPSASSTAAMPANAAKSTPPNNGGTAEDARLLQDMITANDALLKKQAATLQNLDELQKAVEQLKIYSKRG